VIPIASGVRVWIATGHTDMRRGMNSLALLVQEAFKRDPARRRPLCVPWQKRPTRDILHTVVEARQLHIHGIPFLDERFKSHRSDAARI